MRSAVFAACAACLVAVAAAQAPAMAPMPESNYTSIYEYICNHNQTSILCAAVDAAGFDTVLSDPELVATLFAPRDSAFTALLKEKNLTAEALLADNATLTTVLSYHVVLGQVLMMSDLKQGNKYQTYLEGPMGMVKVQVNQTNGDQRLQTTSDQYVKVLGGDHMAGMGIVQLLRTVMLPGNDTFGGSPAAAPMAAMSG